MSDFMNKLSTTFSNAAGSPWTFPVACSIILIWLVVGPFFGFTDTWQLFINTTTTITTFLLGFLIQNTQNRDAKALHLKLDEIILALDKADDDMIDLEHQSDARLKAVEGKFKNLTAKS